MINLILQFSKTIPTLVNYNHMNYSLIEFYAWLTLTLKLWKSQLSSSLAFSPFFSQN